MRGESSEENPYAAPAGETVEPEVEPLLSKPYTALLFFYHFLVACLSLLVFWVIIGVLLRMFLPAKFLPSVDQTPVQSLLAIFLFLPVNRYFRLLMASRRRFDD